MFATSLSVLSILDVSALYVKHQFLHRRHINALPNSSNPKSKSLFSFISSSLAVSLRFKTSHSPSLVSRGIKSQESFFEFWPHRPLFAIVDYVFLLRFTSCPSSSRREILKSQNSLMVTLTSSLSIIVSAMALRFVSYYYSLPRCVESY